MRSFFRTTNRSVRVLSDLLSWIIHISRSSTYFACKRNFATKSSTENSNEIVCDVINRRSQKVMSLIFDPLPTYSKPRTPQQIFPRLIFSLTINIHWTVTNLASFVVWKNMDNRKNAVQHFWLHRKERVALPETIISAPKRDACTEGNGIFNTLCRRLETPLNPNRKRFVQRLN